VKGEVVGVTDQVDKYKKDMTAVVDAACRGDQAAMDELIGHYLPLVYNIVGRALARSADVDDVVQDTMLRVVRGLAGVRDPQRFRSWLVAVTMNEVRSYRQHRHVTPAPPEDIDNLVDPGSDFEDLTLTQLGLSDQRREAALATGWLDDDHRHLLSLWWLVEAGHLSRAEMVEALQLDPHHVTVRVARMKAQLDTARLVVRALAARPGCAGLLDMAASWDGRPTPVWRKRFARHIRDCAHCPNSTSELIPAERLLAGLALVPLPKGLAASAMNYVHTATATTQGFAPVGTHARTTGLLGQARAAAAALPKSLAGVAAAVSVVGGVLLAGYTVMPTQQPASAVAAQSSTATTAPVSPSPAALISTPSTPRASSTPTARPTPSKSPSKSPSAANGLSAAERRLLVLLNERRRELGLPEVKLGASQQRAAKACVQQNLRAGTFDHCGYEVLWASGGNSPPEQMIEAWFNSPAHRAALTHPTSHYAGPAIVWNGSRQVAAINIDY
jgi:RNA polymerase sigma factor (sigma-70 family)